MKVPLGKWLPDIQSLGNPGLSRCINAVPTGLGYRSMMGLAYGSGGVLSTAPILGALSVQKGSTLIDYIGDATKLYSATYVYPTVTQTNVTKVSATYSATVSLKWDFTQYNEFVLACDGGTAGADPIQVIAIGGANFADLGGSPPKAKTIDTIRDFVVVGHTYDATDGERGNRVRWSAFGNHASWAVSASTQADFQDLKSSTGNVQRICGGEDGIIVTENNVFHMIYEGPPTIFRFDEIAEVGTQHAHSVVRIGDYVYFYARQGPVRVGVDGSIKYIARGQCEEFIRRVINAGANPSIIGYYDAQEGAYGLYIVETIKGFQYYPDFDQWTEIFWAVNLSTPAESVPEYYVWGSRIFTTPSNVPLETIAFKASPGPSGLVDDAIYFRGDPTLNDQSGYTTSALELNPGGRAILQLVRLNQSVWGDSADPASPTAVVSVSAFSNMGQADMDHDVVSRAQVPATAESIALTKNTTKNHYEGRIEGRYHFIDIWSEENGNEDRASISEIEVLYSSSSGKY